MARDAYSRKLDEPRLAAHFLKETLELKPDEKKIKLLSDVEKRLAQKELWSMPFSESEKRWRLRKNISDELYNQKRLAHDDDIKLGKGGGKPSGQIKYESKAYIVIGLPAAGKSGICNKISDLAGAYIIDSDYAKRKIPEFKKSSIGASVTHEESSVIIFGRKNYVDFHKFTPLLLQCAQDKANMVIPKIGANPESITELINILDVDCKYKIHLVLVNLDRKDSTVRAFERFIKSKRYVPLSLVFDGYANDPTLTYFRLKERRKKLKIQTFGEIDTTAAVHIKNGDSKSIIYSIK